MLTCFKEEGSYNRGMRCAGSKNVALNEVFAYLVAKLAAEECKELLDLLIDVSSTQNALSWKRTRLFLDHCLQIDDTLIDKKVFCGKSCSCVQYIVFALVIKLITLLERYRSEGRT